MRRTGETTRNIDKAIQILFKEGFLFIPMTELDIRDFIEATSWTYFCTVNIMQTPLLAPIGLEFQKELYDKVRLRLELEHDHLFKQLNGVSFTGNTIELSIDETLREMIYKDYEDGK